VWYAEGSGVEKLKPCTPVTRFDPDGEKLPEEVFL
jgi:hypothetical protein